MNNTRSTLKNVSLMLTILLPSVLPISDGFADVDMTELYMQAQQFQKERDFEKAKQKYVQIVSDPSDGEQAIPSYRGLITCDIQLGRFQEAQVNLNSFMNQYGLSQEASREICDIANHYNFVGKPQEAMSLYQHIVDKWPDDVYAFWSRLGIASGTIQLGNYTEAETALAELKQNYPEDDRLPIALYEIAGRFKSARQYPKALNFFQELTTTWPDHDYALKAHWELISIHLEAGEDNRVEEMFTSMVSRFAAHPEVPVILLRMADKYYHYHHKKSDHSIRYYQYLLDHYPSSAQAMDARFGIIELMLVQRNIDQAEELLTAARQKYASDLRLPAKLCRIADKNIGIDRFDRAEQLYREVLSQWPDSDAAVTAQGGIAITHIRTGQYESAGREVTKLMNTYPSDKKISMVVREVCNHYRHMGKNQEALNLTAQLNQSALNVDQSLNATKSLIITHIQLGDLAQALQTYQQLLDQYGSNEIQHGTLGCALCEIGDHFLSKKQYEAARQTYQDVVDRFAASSCALKALRNVAIAYLAQDQDVQAQGVIDALYTEHANHPDLAYLLLGFYQKYYEKGSALREQGQEQEAMMYFQKALAGWERIIHELPDSFFSPEVHYLCADMYAATDEYGKALSYFQDVADQWPEDPLAGNSLFRVGQCYQKMCSRKLMTRQDAYPMIREVYEKVVSRYPDAPPARAARMWLERNQ